MTPPPKPVMLSEDTFCEDVANGPRLASRIAVVGAGPRSYGFSAACTAPEGPARTPPATRAAASASRTARTAMERGRVVVGDDTSGTP
ncbi:hypothetical protein [Micromonospora sp. NPDC005206]|uniref:hypothetical protein n=1 Tax=Micromonospora sp. NPDC005206 TaxID=3157022 RepID=UPI0033A9D13E